MTSSAPGQWRGHAFGLNIESSFPLDGCPPTGFRHGLPRVGMALGEREIVQARLAPKRETIAWRVDADGARSPCVLHERRAGYLIDEDRFGLFHVSPRGGRVTCAPPGVARWRWQRHLVGRVLPFACTLRGREPWHAGAIAMGASAIVLAGESGLGKSTLVAQFMLSGGTFLADDVVALEPSAGEVRAHPGPGLMSLRQATVEQLSRGEVRRLGVRVGEHPGAIRLAVDRHEEALPVAVVYLLTAARRARRTRLVVASDPDPRWLLASTFNFVVSEPSRLLAQLDACAAIARSARIVRVFVPRDVDLRSLCDHVLADAVRAGS